MNRIDNVNSSVQKRISIPKKDVEAFESSNEDIITFILNQVKYKAEELRSSSPDMGKQTGLSSIVILCAKEYLREPENRMNYIENGKMFSDRQYADVYDIARNKYGVMTSVSSVITIISNYEGVLC